MNIAAQSVVARLPLDAQARLVEQVRAVCKASPLVTPVATNGEPMSVRVTSAGPLGWVGDGRYHYSPVDSRGKPWPPIPTEWIDLANRLAGERSWDCALINWYEPGAKLGLHRDVGERDRSHPILTISIGDAASWAVQVDADEPVHRTRLESGDVTMLCVEHGTRLALHAIERVIDSPMFRPANMRGPGRLSITLRVAG